MAVTQADVDRLEEMWLNGILESKHGDKVVKFRSLDELFKAYERAKDLVAGVNRNVPSTTLASFNAKPGTEGS